jgi:hypothetical protein
MEASSIMKMENFLGPLLKQETTYYCLLCKGIPRIRKLSNVNYQILGGLYHTKKVHWNNTKSCWQYLNHQPIQFSDSEDDSNPEETTQDQGEASTSANPQDPESDDQAEVSQLLESATKTVSTLIIQVSRPQTP